MSDLISRADAIEAVKETLSGNVYWDYVCDAVSELSALPSAEAVQGDGRNNMKRYPNCQMRTSLGNCDAIGGFCTSINAPICDAFHKLVDAVQGEWIEREDWNGDNYYDCSVCGESFVLFDGTPSMNLYHYCPNCGAKMTKGGENE